MSTIPKGFITDLLNRIDIVEIIGSRLQLKKAGANHSALCPFHGEKTPSFTVNQAKQFYHCFGCSLHGDAIDFLMRYDNVSFVEAVEALAQHAGVSVPKDVTATDTPAEFTEFYALLKKISEHYQRQLKQTPIAIEYLKNRGLTGEICKRFTIGFAPADWDNLASLATNKTSKEHLVTNGMLIHKEGTRYYSRFRNRVMFPIRNTRGNIIGFGGRSFGDLPKYLNSPETPLFHKGNELYGLYEAKQHNKNLKELIVVEGYMDVVTLAQFGITWAVATLGTAITPKQTQQLLRHTNTIIYCFDGDAAGRNAAWRALENTLPLMRDGVLVSFLFLPESDDPDSLIRKEGADAFLQRTKQTIPISDFLFQYVTNGANPSTIDGRTSIVIKTKPILQKMPNGIYKQLLYDKLADITKIAIADLQQDQPNNKTSPDNQPNQQIYPQKQRVFPSTIRYAISLLLHNPDIAQHFDNKENIPDNGDEELQLLLELINLLKSQHNLKIGAILNGWRDRPEQLRLLQQLSLHEPLIADTDLQNEFIGAVRKIFRDHCNSLIRELLQKATNDGLSLTEKQALQSLIRKNKDEN